jgi:hypothetical protein
MSYPARCLPPPLAPPFVLDGSSAVMGAAGATRQAGVSATVGSPGFFRVDAGEYHGSFGLLTAITAGPE